MADNSHAALNFTDDNFASEVEGYKGVVLVDFWAEWCGPCRSIAPIIEKLAREFNVAGSKVRIGKLDTDANIATAQKYRIMGIPAMIVYLNGEVHSQVGGYFPGVEAKLRDLIASAIESGSTQSST